MLPVSTGQLLPAALGMPPGLVAAARAREEAASELLLMSVWLSLLLSRSQHPCILARGDDRCMYLAWGNCHKRSFAASLSVTMREKLVMILIALGQAHGSQFAPLVMRARGSVVCVGVVRDAEKGGPRTKCPPRAK